MFGPLCYFILFAILYFSLTQRAGCSEQSLEHESLCSRQCAKNITGTETEIFCKTVAGVISGRCCINTTETDVVIGIDLQECDITDKMLFDGFKNMTDLLYISLQGNDLKKITREDFHRNTKIRYLSLPHNLNCPGGKDFWNDTDNSTSDATFCYGELDACHVYNVTCPENSHCVPSGIGLTECLCNEGYHGYKCMNKGTFPALEFGLGIAIPTVFISALLWVTQRRYVKTNIKKK